MYLLGGGVVGLGGGGGGDGVGGHDGATPRGSKGEGA